jgi:hypothetical protein
VGPELRVFVEGCWIGLIAGGFVVLAMLIAEAVIRARRRHRTSCRDLRIESTPAERMAIARRVYPAEGPRGATGLSDVEKAAVIASMLPFERQMLEQWEAEHPQPSRPWIRDWQRCPEDGYE